MHADDPHRWTRERMTAATLGLLDDAEQRDFDAHLEACDECRARARAYASEPTEPGADGHIPPSLLVARSRGGAALGDFERRAIEGHLAGCRECREDLVWLERTPIPFARAGGAQTGGAGSRWTRAWAIAATAAAAALALVALQPRPRPTPAREPERARAELALVGAPEMLRTPMRGTPRAGGAVVTPGPRGELVLGIEPLDEPGDVPLTVSVLGPGGERLATLECRQRDLERRHTLVVVPSGGDFAAGRYTLAVVARPHDAPAETLALDFRVPRAR